MITDSTDNDRDLFASRRYTSFLIRYWTLSGNRHRIKVEHIQSGEWTQVDTMTAAIEWMDARSDQASSRANRPERDRQAETH